MTVPKVTSPVIDLHVCHPPPLWQQRRSRMEVVLKTQLTQPCDLLHPVATRMSFQFPETRLIQYDCGEQALIAFIVFVIVFMICAPHIWNCKFGYLRTTTVVREKCLYSMLSRAQITYLAQVICDHEGGWPRPRPVHCTSPG